MKTTCKKCEAVILYQDGAWSACEDGGGGCEHDPLLPYDHEEDYEMTQGQYEDAYRDADLLTGTLFLVFIFIVLTLA